MVSKEEEIAKNVEATHCLALVLHISSSNSLGSWSFLDLENLGAVVCRHMKRIYLSFLCC